MMTPISHETYEEIVDYLFDKCNIPGSGFVKDKFLNILAFGPMYDKFTLKYHNHEYCAYLAEDDSYFTNPFYKDLEPDSIGLIHIGSKGKFVTSILIENYIRCDDGSGDIVFMVNSMEYLRQAIMLHRPNIKVYELAIEENSVHKVM